MPRYAYQEDDKSAVERCVGTLRGQLRDVESTSAPPTQLVSVANWDTGFGRSLRLCYVCVSTLVSQTSDGRIKLSELTVSHPPNTEKTPEQHRLVSTLRSAT